MISKINSMNTTPVLDQLQATGSSLRTNISSSSQDSDLVDFLEKYYSLVLLIFGTVGNLLCLAVLSRKTFRRSSVGIYLRFLTLADLCAIYTGVLFFTARSLFNNNFRKIDELSCKFHRWFSFTACDLSSWALVLVSSARLISIAWPMKRLITRRRVYISIFISITVLLGTNFPIFIIYGNLTDPATNKTRLCVFTDDSYEDFYNHVFSWLVLLKFGFLPGVLLIVLNTALVLTVSRSGRAVDKVECQPGTGSSGTGAKVRPSQSLKHLIERYSQETTCSTTGTYSRGTDLTMIRQSDCDTKTGKKGLGKNNWRNILLFLRHRKKYDTDETVRIRHEGLGNWIHNLGVFVVGSSTISKNSHAHYAADASIADTENPSSETEGIIFGKSEDANVEHDSQIWSTAQITGSAWDHHVYLSGISTLNHDITKAQECHQRSAQASDTMLPIVYCISDGSECFPQDNCHDCLGKYGNMLLVNEEGCASNDSPDKMKYVLYEDSVNTVVDEDAETSGETLSMYSLNLNTVREDVVPKNSFKCNNPSHCYSKVNKGDSQIQSGHRQVITGDRQIYTGDSQIHTGNSQVNECDSEVSKSGSHLETDDDKQQESKVINNAPSNVTDTTAQPGFVPNFDNYVVNCHKSNNLHSAQSVNNSTEGNSANSSPNIHNNIALALKYFAHMADKDTTQKQNPNGSPESISSQMNKGRHNRKGNQNKRRRSSIVQPPSKSSSKSRSLTRTLVVINTVFLLCNTPITVYLTGKTYFWPEGEEYSTLQDAVVTIANFTMYTNNAINFILYCVTGTRFRGQLILMFNDLYHLIRSLARRLSTVWKTPS